MLRFLSILIFVCVSFYSLKAQNPCTISNWGNLLSNDCGDIQASGGLAAGSPVIFCEGQTVTVENNSSPVAEIQKTYIDWGDGTCEMFSNFQASMTHIYDFPNDTCILNLDGTIVFNIKLGVEKSCPVNKRSFNSVNFSIKVRFKPIASFNANPQTACISTPVDFTNTSCENTNNPVYLWDMGNGTTFTTENVLDYVYPGGGTYTVSLTVTNSCGSDTETRTISVLPPATANAAPSDTQICAGGTVSFTNTSTNASAYNWIVTPLSGVVFVAPTNSNSATPIIRFNTPGTYTVKLLVVGCGSPEWMTTITVLAPAAINIATIPDQCAATSVSISPTASISGTNTTVMWSFPSGNPGSSSNNSPGPIAYPSQGTFIVTATATNICNTVVDMDTFVVAAQATAAFMPSTTDLCGPDDILTLTNASTNGSSFTWSIMPNSGFTYVSGTNASSVNPQIKFSQEGTYTIKLKVNACGNPETTAIVNVRLKPSVALVNTLDKCEQSISLTPSTLSTIGGGAATSVEWTFLNGSIPTFSGTNPPPVTFSGVNIFAVSVAVSNQCGTQIATDTFKILPLAIAAATISDDTLCAPSELLILTNTTTNAFSNNPYTWSVTPSVGAAFTGGTSATSANPQFLFTKEGLFTIKLEVNGCGMPVWDTTVLVILEPLATVAQIPEGCIDVSLNPLTYTQLTNIGSANINWIFGGATPSTASGAAPGLVNFMGYGNHFISVTVSNVCGSVTSVDSFQIIQPSAVSVTPAGPFCNSDAPVQLQGTPTGMWSGPGVSPTGVFTPANAPLNTPIQLVFQVGSATCTVFDTLIVLVRGTVVAAGLDKSVCSNSGLLSLNNYSPAGGIWTGDSVTTNGVFDPILSNNGANVLSYTFTDPVSGCVNSDQVIITVLGVPTAGLDSIGRTCVDEPLDLGPFSGGVGVASCQWDFGDGGTANVCDPIHTYTTPGNYTLTIFVENSAGCKDTASAEIQVVTPPNALFVTDTTMGCADLAVTINNISAINDYTLYIWNYGNGVIDTLPQPGTIVFTQGETDTIYTIKLQSVNGCGTASASIPITVFPRPQVRFGTDVSSGCTPLEVNFNNVSVGDPNFYRWYVNNVLVDTSFQLPQQVFYTVDQDSTYFIALVAGNECGLDTVIHSVIVKPNPVVAFFNTDTLVGCQPFAIRLIDYSTEGLYVSWDLGDGTTAVGDTVSHTYNTAGTFIVQEFVNNGCGFDTSFISITVLPAPDVSFSHNPYICQGDTLFFQNTSADIIGSYWDFGDGNTDSTQTNTFHVYDMPGQYSVKMTGLAVTTGCPATANSPLEVKTLPEPAVSLPDSLGCQPLTIQPINTTPGNNNFYVWNFGDGTTATGVSGQHIYPDPGQYTIGLVVTDFYGCKNDWSFNPIQVYPKPIAEFTTDQTELCATPTTVLFTNQSVNADAYQWNFGVLGNSTAINPSLLITGPTTISINLQAENQYGCRDTLIRSAKVYTRPDLDFMVADQVGCEPYFVFFENNSTGVNQYSWYFGDGGQSNQASPTHLYETAGVYKVSLYASADSICFDSLVFNNYITVQPSPLSNFSYAFVNDTTVVPNGIVRFSDLSLNAIRWRWDFGDGDTSVQRNPTHRYMVNGPRTVQLITYNIIGCPDTARIEILPEFFGNLYMPNALSPESGSPAEREFRAVGLGLVEFDLSIYASNGQRVWNTKALTEGQPSEGWNGRLNNQGELLPQGVYWWKATARFENGRIWRGMAFEVGGEPITEGKVLLIR